MAGKIRGITIELNGDAKGLTSALDSVNSKLKNTQSTLKDVDRLLKFNPGNADLLAQKQKNLQAAIKGTNDKLTELKQLQGKYAEGSEEWDAVQREIIDTENRLKSLENEYRNFGSVGAQQVAAVGAKMQEIGGAVEGLGQKLAPVSAAAAGVVASLVGLGYNAVTSADDLNTLSKQTGISTDELQKMSYAADLVDVSVDDITGALKKMKSKMDSSNEAFQQLGVSVTDADGNLRSATDVFYDSIEALSQIQNETERDQMAMELFGKSADSLAGIIDDGGASLKDFGQQAEDLGLILDQDTLDSLNAINDTVDQTKARFRGAFAKAGATLAQKFAPALNRAAAFAEKLSDKIANLSPETLGLITKIAGVVAAIAPLLIVGGKLTSGIGKVLALAPKIQAGAKLISGALSLKSLGIMAAIAGFALLVTWVVKHWDQIVEFTHGTVEKIKGAWQGLKDGVAAAVENVKTAVIEKWNGLKESVSRVITNIKTDVYLKWVALKSLVSNTIENIKTAAVEKWEAVKTSVSEIVDGIKESVSTKWEEVKTSVSDSVQNLKNTLNVKWSGIKSSVSTTVTNIKDKITSKWDEAKTNVKTAVTNIKTDVETKWNEIKSSVSTIGQNIANTVKAKFNLAKSNALSIFGNIKSGIEEKINNAKDTVSRVIDDIKGFFDFEWKLPHLKLPHIILHKGVYPWGIFGQGEAPTVDIEWYKKAYDTPMMFTQPTVLQTPQGLKGFGDGHGAEIVLGLNRLRELVGSTSQQVTINVYPPAGANVEQIAAAVEQKLVAAQQRRNRVYA